MIVWQGYAFQWKEQQHDNTITPAYMKLHYEKDVWELYKGLIHPLHIFHDELWTNHPHGKQDEQVEVASDIWSQLTVKELRQYFNNYGSLLLKLHESRLQQQLENV
ncbi:hypothetical protein BDF20DRAFT_853332 [Mycotypha africana]|uniref:uncharacterized protein n=1 Tax=Mycotypha africana TaxID=64632 RepID=UPI0022FFC7AF|nr:uncharacterized protein BDF20DRAFT_853332 [Mycotypha africana]KAI8988014.1 hypothetical protein BDF20DRAFT_853332 [Mycotypha africana]